MSLIIRSNTNRQYKVSVTVGVANADYPTGNYANLSLAIQAAVNYVFSLGGGEVVLLGGTYILPTPGNTVTPKTGVTVRGMGKEVTIIQTARTDYVFKSTAGVAVSDFWIQDMTIDCQNLTDVNAVLLLDATRSGCRNIYFKNSTKWFAKLGSEPSASTTAYCYDCEFTDCIFDTHSSVYEALLIYNAKNTWVQGCTFKNNAANSPTLGLWQKTDNTHIVDCRFESCPEKPIYYGMTCHNTYIERCVFNNCGTGIQGGNVPDNGLFGETFISNLTVNRNYFLGGANSTSSVAIQFGAVNGCYAEGNVIEGYQRGMLFSYGNQVGAVTAPYASKNGFIHHNTFKNLNPSNDTHALHNAIVLTSGSGNGIIFDTNKIADDQSTLTMRYAISFNTASTTYSNVIFINNDLPVDTVNSGTSAKINDSCVVDSSVVFRNNSSWAATNLIKNSVTQPVTYAQGNLTGATTFNHANGDVITGTLTGNVTTTITNGTVVNETLQLVLTQDGTGSRTISKPANVKLVGGAFSPATGANTISSWSLLWDGTYWIQSSPAVLNVS